MKASKHRKQKQRKTQRADISQQHKSWTQNTWMNTNLTVSQPPQPAAWGGIVESLIENVTQSDTLNSHAGPFILEMREVESFGVKTWTLWPGAYYRTACDSRRCEGELLGLFSRGGGSWAPRPKQMHQNFFLLLRKRGLMSVHTGKGRVLWLRQGERY